MKKLYLLFALLALAWTTASAYDFMVDGIAYTKSASVTSVTVTYTTMSSPTETVHSSYIGSVTIPKEVTFDGNTYSVTSIGKYAFAYCSGLTSITIPESITYIDGSAFKWCSGLTSVEYNAIYCQGPTSVEDIWFLGKPLTSLKIGDKVKYIPSYLAIRQEELTSITIPNSVTSIGDYAFEFCSGLTSITIPNSVTSIDKGAFAYCSGLTSITIPNSVTYIGNSAVKNCSGLNSVEYNAVKLSGPSSSSYAWFNGCPLKTLRIGEEVKSIPNYLAYEQNELASITIPNSVTYIGEKAFYNCSDLTTITIPNSVTSIGNGAFNGCSGLTSVEYNAVKCSGPFSSSEAWFTGCTMKTLKIGDKVEGIPSYLAYEQNEINSITIPNSVTYIGESAFAYCSDLASVTIPNSVTSIGESAFAYCSDLASITIPNSVTYIGEKAFCYCSGLTSVEYNAVKPSGVTSYSRAWFTGCPLKILKIGDKVERIPKYFVYGQKELTSVTIPNSVTNIGESAFAYCSGLTSLSIPNSITSIDRYAFSYCSGLTSVTIPISITSISDGTFAYCSGLTSVTIPISITSIGSAAFRDCTGLTSVTIPNAVTSVGTYALNGCTALNEVRVQCDYPPTANTNTFSTETYRSATLYVPKGKYDIYSRKDAWRDFATILEDGESSGGNLEGDVNGDGKVDVSDINRIIDIILGQ